MRLYLRSKVEVPAEILLEILRNMSQRNLKRARLVCMELAALARRMLFKRISISPVIRDVDRFLHVIRDAELSQAVEELTYREMHIEPWTDPWLRSVGEGSPYESIIQHHYLYETEDETEDEAEDETAAARRRDRIHEMLDQVRQEYQNQAAAMKSGYDFDALVEGLLAMRNLKRIITKDSRPYGISTETGFEPPSLGLLQAHFPASDASLRLGIFPDPLTSPDHGLFTILRALAATGANVPMLVTERTTGLLKQGVSSLKFSRREPFHQEYARGFQQLRKISLCVDDDWGLPSTTSRVEDTAISACIIAATHLEHLELSLTHKNTLNGTCLPLRCFLPYTALRKLHTLVLEGVHATAKEITSFLVLQAASLRHLTLWDVRLLADDLWEHVLAVLCVFKTFHLDSFVLKSPEDADVRQHQEIGEVPARILDEDVLHFVNDGGINPFTKRDWRPEPPDDTDVDAASDVSDVSDFSVWKDKQTDALEDIDLDTDGPEYDSDYDTDPDTDFEGTFDDSDLSDIELDTALEA
jgi:hypothetical protein